MHKALRIFGIALVSLLFLLMVAVILLLTPPGERIIRVQAEKFLEKKIGKDIHIGALHYKLPKRLVLKQVFIPDFYNDTLLFAGVLDVNLDMLALLGNKVKVNDLSLHHAFVNLQRHRTDSFFNFQYIVDAFTAEQEKVEKKPATTVDSAAALQLDVDILALNNVRFKMNDAAGGIFLQTFIAQLDAEFDKIDLSSETYLLKTLQVNGWSTDMVQSKSYLHETIDTADDPLKLIVGAKEIQLKNTNFFYRDAQSNMRMKIGLKRALVAAEPIHLANQFIAIHNLQIDTAFTHIVMENYDHQLAAAVDSAFAFEDTTEAQGWRIAANKAGLQQVDFSFNNNRIAATPYGIDYNHLDIRNLNFKAARILYTADTIFGQVQHLALQEKSGLNLEELRTDLVYHNQGGILQNLFLKTEKSLLQRYVKVRYPSVEALTNNLSNLQVWSDINNSTVAVSDLLLFAPQLRSNDLFKTYPNARINLVLQLSGMVNALQIHRLYLAGLGNNKVDVSGSLNGLPNVNNLNYRLRIAEVRTTRQDLSSFLPPSVLADIRLPDNLHARGTLNGNLYTYYPDLSVQTSDGNLQAQGYFSIADKKERYDLKLFTQDLNIGRIIKQEDEIGRLSASLTIKGSGFDPKTMNSVFDGIITKAEYNGYAYNNIKLNGTAKSGIIELDAVSNDPNAQLDLQTQINLQGSQMIVSGKVMLDSIDLQRLGFIDKEFRIRGKIIANFQDVNPDYPIGTITMDHPVVVYDGNRYVLDSLYLVSEPQNGNQNISLYADVISAELTGRLPLTRSGDVILQRINQYYRLTTKNNLAAKPQEPLPADYDLTFHAQVYDRPLLYAFIPNLTYFDSASVYASFTPYLMSVDANMPSLNMGENKIYDFQLSASGAENAMIYNINIGHLQFPFVELWAGTAKGEVKNDVIHTFLSVGDKLKKERFAIGGLLYRDEGMQTLSISDSLVMNYAKWQVAQPNRIAYGDAGIFVDNFKISHNDESIALASSPPQFGGYLKADINNFGLYNIVSMLNQDTLLLNGRLNGSVNVTQFDDPMIMDADLKINDLSIYGDTVGLFTLVGAMNDGNKMNIEARISEQQNDVRLLGNYYLKPVNGNQLDFNLMLNALNLASFQGASLGALKNSSGFIRGETRIKGTIDRPQINGALRTDQLATTVAMLGGKFTMPNEKITFDGSGVRFNQFQIYDSLQKSLTVNGTMKTVNWQDYDFDMRIAGEQWMLMNSTSKVNKDYHGRVIISPDITIGGNTRSLNIDGSLTVHDSTDLTVALPETRKELQSSEGIVHFTDFSDSNAHLLVTRIMDTIKTLKLALGSTVNVNVNVEKLATITVLMEEGAGDFLRVRGQASLNTVVNPDGTLGLTGNYELESGSYEFNYNFIKRKFTIEKGSSITFLGGDPTQAQLNVRAIYEADIAPYDLVENQVDQNDLVYYQQRLPFQIILQLKGQLLKPELTFDIELPEEKSVRAGRGVAETVQGKLASLRNNQSELNKQVFAVLLLNRFVAENPFSTSNALQIEHAVRQSVSRFLTEQLNRFADQIIEGFDLSLDLNSSEDYTTGEKRNRTDLSLAASKKLLNNRLTVTIGNDFTLEGPAGNRQQSFIPGNLSLDYALTADGRYAVRAYRTNRDMGVVEGYVVETGVKFRVNVNYNKFRYLFEKPEKRKVREQKELEKAYKEQSRQSAQ